MSKLKDEQLRELDRLAELPDEQIDTSDIPEVLDFSDAIRGRFHRNTRQPVTVRIDRDILDWFASHGEPLQSHINAALRNYVEQRSSS